MRAAKARCGLPTGRPPGAAKLLTETEPLERRVYDEIGLVEVANSGAAQSVFDEIDERSGWRAHGPRPPVGAESRPGEGGPEPERLKPGCAVTMETAEVSDSSARPVAFESGSLGLGDAALGHTPAGGLCRA